MQIQRRCQARETTLARTGPPGGLLPAEGLAFVVPQRPTTPAEQRLFMRCSSTVRSGRGVRNRIALGAIAQLRNLPLVRLDDECLLWVDSVEKLTSKT